MHQRKRPPTVDPVFSFYPSLHLSCSVLCLIVSLITFTKWLLSWTLAFGHLPFQVGTFENKAHPLKGGSKENDLGTILSSSVNIFFLSPPCSHATRTKGTNRTMTCAFATLSQWMESWVSYLCLLASSSLAESPRNQLQKYISFHIRVLKHILGHVSLIPMPT